MKLQWSTIHGHQKTERQQKERIVPSYSVISLCTTCCNKYCLQSFHFIGPTKRRKWLKWTEQEDRHDLYSYTKSETIILYTRDASLLKTVSEQLVECSKETYWLLLLIQISQERCRRVTVGALVGIQFSYMYTVRMMTNTAAHNRIFWWQVAILKAKHKIINVHVAIPLGGIPTFTIQKGQSLQALLGLRSVISSRILNPP